MSKKSVEYIREVHKTGKRKNKVKAKSNFCQFRVGGRMKNKIKYYTQKYKEMGITPASDSENISFRKLSILKDVEITTAPTINIKEEDIF